MGFILTAAAQPHPKLVSTHLPFSPSVLRGVHCFTSLSHFSFDRCPFWHLLADLMPNHLTSRNTARDLNQECQLTLRNSPLPIVKIDTQYSALHVRLESKSHENLFVLVMCDIALQCHSET